MKHLVAFACGLLFAVGLAVSGMTLPAKVVGFLDVGGAWDPSLALVMMGALAVLFAARLVTPSRPLFDAAFPSVRTHGIDARLVAGAALFGVGWGLVGLCPGPAVVVLGAGVHGAFVFGAAMVVGMTAEHALFSLPKNQACLS